MSKNILVVVHPKIGACQYFRQVHPHENLSDEFNVTYRHVLELIPKTELSRYHLVVMHTSLVTLEFLETLKGLNIHSMVDFDDYWQLPSAHPLAGAYQKNKTTKKLIEVLKKADYISVTTHRLADEARKYNGNVLVYPNCIEPGLIHSKIIDMPGWDRLQIGYLAGSTHVSDMELLQGLNNRLMHSGLRYNLNLFGYKHDTPYQRYAEILTGNGGYSENLLLHASLPIPDYLMLYNMVDVALAPLRNNTFNQMKSELKLVEAGSFKIPVIASDTHPYKDVIRHRRNGLLAGNKKDWYKCIKYFIDNPRAVEDMGKQLHADINQHFNYGNIRQEREDTYAFIIQSGKKLHTGRGVQNKPDRKK